MIKAYLQLIRFPGIFTVISNVLVGFLLISKTNAEWNFAIPIISISGLLFMSGMTLNDYFDFNLDKKEKRKRPLVLGKIPKKNALYLGIIFLCCANIIAVFVSEQTLLISLLMSALIISYNIKLKNIASFGIFSLSIIRFFNIILGATLVEFNFEMFQLGIPLAILIVGTSMLAKNETSIVSKKIMFSNWLCLVISVLAIFIITGEDGIDSIFLIIFVISILIPHIIYKKDVQKIITHQLFSIILLDSVIIASFSEPAYAVITALLYVPAYIASKKMYLT